MMLTRCPTCGTAFRVTPEQLKARAGKVRCGHCNGVFNALETLEDTPPAVHEVEGDAFVWAGESVFDTLRRHIEQINLANESDFFVWQPNDGYDSTVLFKAGKIVALAFDDASQQKIPKIRCLQHNIEYRRQEERPLLRDSRNEGQLTLFSGHSDEREQKAQPLVTCQVQLLELRKSQLKPFFYHLVARLNDQGENFFNPNYAGLKQTLRACTAPFFVAIRADSKIVEPDDRFSAIDFPADDGHNPNVTISDLSTLFAEHRQTQVYDYVRSIPAAGHPKVLPSYTPHCVHLPRLKDRALHFWHYEVTHGDYCRLKFKALNKRKRKLAAR